MNKRNGIALGIFVVFYISFGLWLSLSQEQFIYQPDNQNFTECPALSHAQQVSHRGTRMYTSQKNTALVVLYHGNAGSACDRAFYAKLATQAGLGYILVEYAGYSNDSREPTHKLLKQDVRNVISYLKKEQVQNVIVAGESIGTGLASYHASLKPPHKLVLISPFTDLVDLAHTHFWWYPSSFLTNNAFDNQAQLATYKGRVLMIHGTNDAVIPYHLGRTLYRSLSGEKYFVSVEGAGHNDLFLYDQTHTELQTFLEEE